jgi:hypothetical protein
LKNEESAMKATLLSSVATVAGLFALGMGIAPAEAAFSQSGTASGNECAGASFSSCTFNGSPAIIRFNGDLGVEAISTNFPTVTGAEFTLTSTDPTGNSTGTWSYAPGAGDPGITGYIVFAADQQNHFTGTGFSGSWATATGQDLSHITFFDTAVVPLPAALPLLGSGLVALWGLGRMRRQGSGEHATA